MATVPDTNTFSLRDVESVVAPIEESLQGCFDDAIGTKYDPAYEGSRDRLSNFRNYGSSALLTYKSFFAAGVVGVPLWGSHKNATYFYWIDNVSHIIYVMSINGFGVISQYDFESISAYDPVYCLHILDDENIFVVVYNASSNRATVKYWGYNGSSFAEYDSEEYSDSFIYDEPTLITVDENNKFIFWAEAYYTDSIGKIYITSYSTSTKTLSHETTFTVGYGIHKMYYQSGYIHVLCRLGSYTFLRSYSINSSTGALTYVDTITVANSYIYGINGNQDDLIFLSKGNVHYCYSSGGGHYQLKDTDTISNGEGFNLDFDPLSRAVFFMDRYTGHDYLFSKRVNSADDFITEQTMDWSAYSTGTGNLVMVLENRGFVLITTTVTNRIIAFQIT